MADATMTIANVDAILAERFNTDQSKAQFARLTTTLKWFRAKFDKIMGRRYHFYMFYQPATPTRRSSFANFVANEAPAAQAFAHKELTYDDDDMVSFEATAEMNVIADIETIEARANTAAEYKGAVYQLAMKYAGEIENDVAEQLNLAPHQGSTCVMGTVAAIYDEDGTSYTSGQADAFLQITDMPIGAFKPGMEITLNATETVTVNDVIYGPDGPWSGGTRVASIGPGIVVTRATSNLDGVQVGDPIVRSGEDTNIFGFSSWFSGITNVYNDSAGSAIDRDAKGNAFMIPNLFNYTGSPTLDLDTHLKPIGAYMTQRMNTGRSNRERLNPDEALNMAATPVLIGPPDLIDTAAEYAADYMQFTASAATTMDGAKSREFFGNIGFTGVTWQSPSLGVVALQADAAAEPGKLRMLDPQSWCMLGLQNGDGAGKNYSVKWLKNDAGGNWHSVLGSNGRPTKKKVATCYVLALLYCDQPGVNTEISGVVA